MIIDALTEPAPTLNEVLARLGYERRPGTTSQWELLRGGEVVFRYRTVEHVWAWLTERGEVRR